MPGTQDRVPSVFSISLIQIMAAVFLFIALIQRHLELILLMSLLLSLTLGARLWGRFSPKALNCRVSVDKARVFPGDRLCLHMDLENVKALPVRLSFHLSMDSGLRPMDTETGSSFELRLLWYQHAGLRQDLVAKRRGIYQAGAKGLLTSDLFGFYPHKPDQQQAEAEIIVYPRLASLKPAILPRRDFFGKPGGRSPVEDPVYLLGTRDYQQGRPSRFIHWKASARHDRLMEKVFEPSHAEKILLLVDAAGFQDQHAGDAFEDVLQTAAALAVHLDRTGANVGLVINARLYGAHTGIVPIGRSPLRLQSLLEVLARATMQAEGNLIQILQRSRQLSRGLACLCFIHTPDAPARALDLHLFKRNIPALFLSGSKTIAPGDTSPPLHARIWDLDRIRFQEREQS